MIINNKAVSNIVDFIEYSEGLKTTYRNSWLSDGNVESVAEHTWRMGLIAMTLFPHIDKDLNKEKVLKMIKKYLLLIFSAVAEELLTDLEKPG